MNYFKKITFSLLSLLIISCGKIKNEEETNTDLDTVSKTETTDIAKSQNEESTQESSSLEQNETKGSILGEAKFKKKQVDSVGVQTSSTNPSTAATEISSSTETKTDSPKSAPKKAAAPSKYNILKILNGCEVGQILTQEELSKNLSIPRDAIKLVKSIKKISDNEIEVKWNSTWAVEKISDAEFEDGRIKAVVKNNTMYISGGAIGIRYNKKTYTDLEVVGRAAKIPSVKGYYWQIGRD
jgi:metal-sulfur cluster biosynthetic enzyme